MITRDPETGLLNAGSYRMMVSPDGKTTWIHMIGNRHGIANANAWFEREGRCPIVASVGHDPLLFALAGNDIPYGISELEYAGAILGEPVTAVRGATGLPIPAQSEVVIEGWIYPDRKSLEGPFGEWHGHYSGLRRNGERTGQPDYILDIVRVYHRNDPILLGAPPGQPPHDFTYFRSVLKSAMIKDSLTKAGVPGVKGDVTVERKMPYSSRAVIDACIPMERRETSWMVCEVKPEVLAAVRQRFAHLWP